MTKKKKIRPWLFLDANISKSCFAEEMFILILTLIRKLTRFIVRYYWFFINLESNLYPMQYHLLFLLSLCCNDFFFSFLLTSIFHVRKKYWNRENFWHPVFLTDLHALGCPEHDLTNSGKYLSVCVCDNNILAIVARDLMHGIS